MSRSSPVHPIAEARPKSPSDVAARAPYRLLSVRSDHHPFAMRHTGIGTNRTGKQPAWVTTNPKPQPTARGNNGDRIVHRNAALSRPKRGLAYFYHEKYPAQWSAARRGENHDHRPIGCSSQHVRFLSRSVGKHSDFDGGYFAGGGSRAVNTQRWRLCGISHCIAHLWERLQPIG